MPPRLPSLAHLAMPFAVGVVALAPVACGSGQRAPRTISCARTAVTATVVAPTPTRYAFVPPTPLYPVETATTFVPTTATFTPTPAPATATPTFTPTRIPPPPESTPFRPPAPAFTPVPRAPIPEPADVRIGNDGCYFAQVSGYRWDESQRRTDDGRLVIYLSTPSRPCMVAAFDPTADTIESWIC